MRSLILAIPFVLIATLLSAPTAKASALALPVPYPMPFRNADYNNHLASLPHATRHDVDKSRTTAVPSKPYHNGPVNASSVRHGYSARTYHQSIGISRRDFNSLLEGLGGHRDDAVADSQELQNMASQSASRDENDSTFQQGAASRFSSFSSSTQGFSDLFGQLAADKGLANYDKDNSLEVMLKDVVNANKDALSAVTALVYNIPDLGPVLGPIVYEIKCIVDDLLDLTENLTDGILNDMKPMLQGLLGQAAGMTCASQFKVLGFCL
ncbi:hypothetical protein ACEPAF_3633 [Sanghuangporus sanghuang]|uniref:Uncharacterized protein n=1 Tax=Sanghuangporus baumii TaxID=108892 RepID=A0A9Q5NBP7_SANBA|nr:hypothetical protein A7U60_g828 [Sanghuangporus baumii]